MNAPFHADPAAGGAPAAAELPPLNLLIAAPRGFCAGVDRAIEIVERALERYGRPVYVRHEIVHNKYVVEQLKEKGAIFVKELDEVPDDAPVVFSAHGVPKAIPAEARRRQLLYVDATCPLVSKIHRQAERQIEKGRHIIFIGHEGHPEVIGTMGQVEPGQMTLVETIEDVDKLPFDSDEELAYLTQTTLSVDDTREVIQALEWRYPNISGPRAEDIGAPNSSNSLRLVEVSERLGTPAKLIQRASEIDFGWLEGVQTLGLTAGASAPEILVREVVAELAKRRSITEREITATVEKMIFKLPRQLTE
jgi:4-hydroxy-3-methylbut-2-enyl diphosphate reductase